MKKQAQQTAKANTSFIYGKYLYAFSIVSLIQTTETQNCVLHSGVVDDIEMIKSHIEKAFKTLETKYRNSISLVNFHIKEIDKEPIVINLNSFKNSIENIDQVLIEEIEKILENKAV